MDIGVDIEEIFRIERAIKRHCSFRERIFSDRERGYCESLSDPYPCYAARFSAKEAVRKATGVFYSFGDIEVLRDSDGKPKVFISGLPRDDIKISISHTRAYVVVVVMVE